MLDMPAQCGTYLLLPKPSTESIKHPGLLLCGH